MQRGVSFTFVTKMAATMNKMIWIFISVATVWTAHASDAWMQSGADAAYPRELYFVGVGMSERGQDEARTNAVIEVKKQISVHVNASLLDKQTSVKTGDTEESSSSTQSRARLSTRGDVQGIEVVKTGQKESVFYALAVLDKQNFAANCRTIIAENKQKLEARMSAARKALGSGAVGAALKELAAARKALKKIHEQRTLLSAASQLTEKEQVNYTESDIDQLAEKCMASVETDIVSGNRQEVAAGEEPAFPLVVEVTAGSSPAPMIPLELVGENGDILVTEYTDENGRAQFELGNKTATEIGRHSVSARIALNVSASARKILDAQTQRFTYTVSAKAVHVAIEVNLPSQLETEKALIRKKLVKRMAKYNIMDYPQSCFKLVADVSAQETGRVDGVSASRTFVKTAVDANFMLYDKQQRQQLSFTASGKGVGSTVAKSTAKAIGELRVKSNAARIAEAVSGSPDQHCGRVAASEPVKQASKPVAQHAPAPQKTSAPGNAASGDGSNPENAALLQADGQWRKNTYINSEKWFYFNAQANGSYLLYVDSDRNNKTGSYSAWGTRLEVFRENLLDELDYTGSGGHYLTDPYRINTPVAEKVYVKVYGYQNEKNATFGAKFVQSE